MMYTVQMLRRWARSVAFWTGLIRYYWKWRHFIDGKYSEARPCSCQPDAHRSRLAQLIASLQPTSCVEVGCADGANLNVLATRLPHCVISGVDLNQKALDIATSRVRAAGGMLGVMRLGDVAQLPLASQSADVVFSDAVGMYLTPKKLECSVREMRRVARRAILIHTFADDSLARGSLIDGNWVHPVARVITQQIPGAYVISERSLIRDSQWQRYGTTYIATW